MTENARVRDSRVGARDFLAAAHREGRLAHAYLVTGGAAEEREALVRWLAGCLLCERGGGCDPQEAGSVDSGRRPYESTRKPKDAAEECRGCRLLRVGNHPDLTILEPDGGSIKIGQTRELRRDLYLRPVSGRGRLCGILEAQAMTEEAAQSLLKLLEEPPSFLLFVLTAPHPGTFLPTILSRCQHLPLFRGGASGETRAFSPTDRRSDHPPDGARPTGAGSETASRILAAVARCHEWGEREWAAATSTFEADKEERREAIDLLARWFRDLTRVTVGAGPDLFPEWEAALAAQAERVEPAQALAAYQAVADAASAYDRNGQWRLLLEVLVFRLRGILTARRPG